MAITDDRSIFALTPLYVGAETTPGGATTPAATDATCSITWSIAGNRAVDIIDDVCASSLVGLETRALAGRWDIGWAIEAHVAPSGTAGTPPDLHPLWQAIGGSGGYTNTGATSDVYLLDESVAPTTFWMFGGSLRTSGTNTLGNAAQMAAGCVVETVTIEGSTTQRPKITASGKAMEYCQIGRAQVDGAHTAPDTTITVDTDHGFRIAGTSTAILALPKVQFMTTAGAVDESNGGAGYSVNGLPTSTVVTIDPTLAGNVDDNSHIVPLIPTRTLSGTPILPNFDVTWGGTSLDSVTGYKITVNTNRVMVEEASVLYPAGVAQQGRYEVTVELTFTVRASDELGLLEQTLRAPAGKALNIAYTSEAAGKRFALYAAKCILNATPDPLPRADGVHTLTVTARAFESSAGAGDAFRATFT